MSDQPSLFPQFFQNKFYPEKRNADEEVKLINKEEFDKIKSGTQKKNYHPNEIIQICESPYKPLNTLEANCDLEKKIEKVKEKQEKKPHDLKLKKTIRKSQPIKKLAENIEKIMPFFSKSDTYKFPCGIPSEEILDCDKFLYENFPKRNHVVGHKRIFRKKNVVKFYLNILKLK